jgi:TonB family protein
MPVFCVARISVACLLLAICWLNCAQAIAGELLNDGCKLAVFGRRSNVATIEPQNIFAAIGSKRNPIGIQGIIPASRFYVTTAAIKVLSPTSTQFSVTPWHNWYLNVFSRIAELWKPQVPGQAAVYLSAKQNGEISIVKIVGFLPGLGPDGQFVLSRLGQPAQPVFVRDIEAAIKEMQSTTKSLHFPSVVSSDEAALCLIFACDTEAIFRYPDSCWFSPPPNTERELQAQRACFLLRASGYPNSALRIATVLQVPLPPPTAGVTPFIFYGNGGVGEGFRFGVRDASKDFQLGTGLLEKWNSIPPKNRLQSKLFESIRAKAFEPPARPPPPEQRHIGAGTGEGPAGGMIATRLPASIAISKGNIAPYRKKILTLIAQNWHPLKACGELVVLLNIARDGELLSAEIFQSSGNKKIDASALEAARITQYDPLPDWYKGENLNFKVELSKVEQLGGVELSKVERMGGGSLSNLTPSEDGIAKEIAYAALERIRHRWQGSTGPMVSFQIRKSSGIREMKIINDSNDPKDIEQAMKLLRSLTLPSLPSSFSADALTIQFDLGQMRVLEWHMEPHL